ncbi:MAG: prepilin-type N-terminal cleavage/methylation domain-containing protein [Verrucomicrobia bacterium]|nr:prepilin-type N-terminal cleavage/methylation domain-containing protein [Verrucomicrobiota bacterium]MBV9658129.1 prepilin-type N-terminal cleavage/methylation domain-containing protein [Verrucomicrobiota bacterium]
MRTSQPIFLRTRRSARAGFTLVEMLLAMMIGAVIFGAALAAMANLQKSYAATEQYAASLSDQMRLVDYLSMDLRRATVVTFDGDGYGVTLTLPDYYYFDAADKQHVNPLPNLPIVPDDHSRAIYGNPALPPLIYYHFDVTPGSDPVTGSITREEVAAGQTLTGQAPAQARVADNVAAASPDPAKAGVAPFLWMVVPDNNSNPPLQARVTASFHPMFQTPATPNSNFITLHNTIFLRNNDSHR